MRKFEFTLGRILDYRQSLLEKEKNTLMQMFARRNQLETQLERSKNGYTALSRELTALSASGTTAVELQRLDLKLRASKAIVKEQTQQLAAQEQQIDQQRQTVVEASREVAALEKLRDHQREDYDAAVRKEETERIAEIVSSQVARGENGMPKL
ncbi:MAG: flagellar export protein FliJ [Angelakisella sp.]